MTPEQFENLVSLIFVPTSDFPVSVETVRDMGGNWVPGVQVTPTVGEDHVWPKFYPFEVIEPLTEKEVSVLCFSTETCSETHIDQRSTKA